MTFVFVLFPVSFA